MVDQLGWPYEVLLDPNSDLKRALGIQLIPYTLVIDGEGKIVYRHLGYADGEEEELIEEVRKLVSSETEVEKAEREETDGEEWYFPIASSNCSCSSAFR